MAHIGKEGCLLLTCHFRHLPGYFQLFLYLLQAGNVTHGQQYLFISVQQHICTRNAHYTIHIITGIIRQIKPHRGFQLGKAVFFAKALFDGSTHRAIFAVLVSAARTWIQCILATEQLTHPMKDAVVRLVVQTIIIGFLYQKITIGQYDVRINITQDGIRKILV